MDGESRPQVIYPEVPEFQCAPRFWHRCRIVIPCFDESQANSISEKVAEFCGHSVEHLWCVTDDAGTAIRGEMVIGRRLVPVTAMALIEDEET
jgi:hypothetical protein